MQLVVAIKGNAQFLFLCNPQKLGTSQVYITSFLSNSKNCKLNTYFTGWK